MKRNKAFFLFSIIIAAGLLQATPLAAQQNKRKKAVRSNVVVVEEVANTGSANDPVALNPGITSVERGKESSPPHEVYTYVSQMPEFSGDMNKFIREQLKYPQNAREAGQEGRTIVSFIVTKSGDLDSIRVARSSGSSSLDAEAVRIVSAMPLWKPGRNNGIPVNVSYMLPITFKLN